METENEKSSEINAVDAESVPVPIQDCDEDIAEILEGVPQERRAELLRLVAASESHSGWLPTPKYLAEYERILPGLAERIVAMPEREQAHRHRVIEQVVEDDRTLKSRGQIFAISSLTLLLAVSVYLIYLGQYAWGARVAIFGVIGVVGIFVTGKWADVKVAKASKDDPEEDDSAT